MRLRKIIILLLVQAVAVTIATAQSHVSDTLFIYFKVGKTNVVPQFMDNSTTLKTFDRFLKDYKSPRFNFELKGITLQGSASPEGKKHWNIILANRRADAIMKYITNQHPEYQRFVQKDNLKLNNGAHYTLWPDLRSTRIVVDYLRFSKEPKLPQIQQPAMPAIESNLPKAPLAYSLVPHAAPESTIPEKATAVLEKCLGKDFRIALKTNALYDLLLVPNIGIEVPVLNKWSIAANWMYAWWKTDSQHWYHRVYGGDVEIRRWINKLPWQTQSKNSTSPLTGYHIGAYGQMITYDFEFGGNGVLGDKWSWGAGIAVGYSKNIAPKLNLDFTLGVGYLTGEYIEYKPIDNCYVWQATKNRQWFGPTKAEVSLVWLLGRW